MQKYYRSLVSDRSLYNLKKQALKSIPIEKYLKLKPILEETDKQIEEINTKLHNIKRQLAFIFSQIENQTKTKREFKALAYSDTYHPTINRLNIEKVKLKKELLVLQLKERDLLGIKLKSHKKTKNKGKKKPKIKRND